MARTVIIAELGLSALQRNPLSKVDGTVLWHLVDTLPPTGAIISKVDLETMLSISHVQINNTLKRLCEIGFLLRGEKIGVSYHYKLNPTFLKVLS